MTYLGKPISGTPFFELLYSDEEFCAELGRCALAASRLEVALIYFLEKNNISCRENASLGELIVQTKKTYLDKNIVRALEDIKDQRNHMIHRIFSLFSGLIEETRLPRSNLIDSDVWTYTNYAVQLRENLNDLCETILNEIPKKKTTALE